MTTRPLLRVSRSYAAQALDGEWLSLKNRVWVLIALAVGFFVRVNELGAQSLWNDEGTSVALAQLSIGAIVNAAARDIHPPLYYLLLSAWIPFVGISEFAMRFLSVFAGGLVIALTFRIAREFFDQDVATIAAVLAALNSFQTYYAQETRMYIWVTLFAALSVWSMIVMLRPPRRETSSLAQGGVRRRTAFWILYIVSTLAALYTNYYAFTLIVFENLAFLAWLAWAWRARRPSVPHSIGFWIGAQILIALAYVPWLNFARQSLTSWPGISEPMSVLDMLWRVASAFVTGIDSPRDFQILLVAMYFLFFFGGLLPSRDLFRSSAWGIITCALWAFLPFLAMYFVSLTRPAYNPKFLLLASPGFLIVVARGVSVLYPGLFLRERAPYGSLSDPAQKRLARQLLGIGKLFVGALFAGGTVLALQNLYRDPRLQRDDYRGIVNYINALATERDAVIVNAPGQLDVVRYYFNSPAQLVGLPIGRPVHEEQTRAALADLLAKHEKLFAIHWATEQADPQQFVERSLSQVSYKASETWHGNVQLAEYAVSLSPNSFPARIYFGDEIFLRRFRIEDKALAGGDILPLELVWVALKPLQTNYKVFVHFVDAQGHIVAQHDGEPQNGFAPTSRWGEAEEISDKLGISIPVGTMPGEYALVVGLYRGDTGVRLKLVNGQDALTLGTVTVSKKILPRAATLARTRASATFDAIELFGYTLTFPSPNRSTFAPGEFIPLVLYFQARELSARDLQINVELRDQGNNVIASARAFENYPTSQWEQNEIVRDTQTLAIPSNALPGEYRIVVTDGAQSYELTRVQVR